jgi:hypothetical protein
LIFFASIKALHGSLYKFYSQTFPKDFHVQMLLSIWQEFDTLETAKAYCQKNTRHYDPKDVIIFETGCWFVKSTLKIKHINLTVFNVLWQRFQCLDKYFKIVCVHISFPGWAHENKIIWGNNFGSWVNQYKRAFGKKEDETLTNNDKLFVFILLLRCVLCRYWHLKAPN